MVIGVIFRVGRIAHRAVLPYKNIRMRRLVYFFIILILSCSEDEQNPPTNPYTLKRPDYFPEIAYPIDNNPITQEGFELGKKLFNDPRLSLDNSISCSSCHVQSVAFTDPQHNPSIGIFEQAGTRNAPMIANMAFHSEFLWDGGVSHLDFVSVFAIENEREMGAKLRNIVEKLRNISEYPPLFKKAFPDLDSIQSPYLLRALSQYMLLLVSDNAKYDKVQRGEDTFSPAELEGLDVFQKKCASCHAAPLFTNLRYMNNGIDSVFTDVGRMLISARDEDIGKFKVPSLRNVSLTSPYMHDGRFKTLEEVLEHYGNGVVHSESLAHQLMRDDTLGIPMTDEEVEHILIFLETLSDYDFIRNPLF